MKHLFFKKTLIISFFVAVALLLPVFCETGSAVVMEAEAKTYEELQKEHQEALAKQKAKEAERKAAKARLEEAKKALEGTLNKMQEIELQMYSLEEEQMHVNQEKEITEFLISIYGERQAYYQSLIDEQRAKMDETLELYATVLRYKYENGETNTLEILFNSENFEQFLSRLQYFDNIIEYNDTVADALGKIEKELNTLQEQYNSALDNLSYYTDLLEKQETDIRSRQEELEKLNEEYKALYEQQVNEKEAQQKLEKELAIQAEILAQAVKDAEQAILNYNTSLSAFGWPLKPGVWYYVSSYFGWRNDPLGRGYQHHSGLDIAAGGGNAVLAVCDGVVTTAKWHNSYGNYVVIYHGDGTSSLYAHMMNKSITVKVGDKVKRGQQIGKVGTTGDSTGNHLHFSVLVNGAYLNPDDYLPDGYYVKKYYPAIKPSK
ncbi:MAG: peptidoglycan DD-metalloendopeptidase family protein [Clostridia bacterium]|nr:peptidoglycan DD-metalloendopeptidase family protein [Clostridia bacterium]